MIVLIAKALFFFITILTISVLVFTILVRIVGKFFNVAIAPDSVLAAIINKLSRR